MQYQRIRIQNERGVLHVVLARPAVRNAFDALTISELTKVFNGVADDASIRVVVLSGEGSSFCSGADLTYMQSMAGFSREENKADAERLFSMFEAVRSCATPVIVHLHGHAMGGALGITACADIALAETGTQFRFSEVRLGILPAVISPFVLQKMNPLWARRWMTTGEMFDADEAMKAGLLHFVGSADEVRKEKEKAILALIEASPGSVRATKELLKSVGFLDPLLVRGQVTDAIADRRIGPEGQEGLKAFIEKREPSWRK